MNAMVQFTDAYHSSIVDSPVFVKGNILVVYDQGVMKEIEISGQKDIVSQTRGMWYVGIKSGPPAEPVVCTAPGRRNYWLPDTGSE